MNTPEHDLEVMLSEQDESDLFFDDVEKLAQKMCAVPSIKELFAACTAEQEDELYEIVSQAAEREVRRQINEDKEI
jgi:hypothetical protein